MDFDRLLQQLRILDPSVLDMPPSPRQEQLVRAVLQAVRNAAEQTAPGKPQHLPGLGVFRHRPPPPEGEAGGRPRRRMMFVPDETPALQEDTARRWRDALCQAEPPLPDPQGRFVVLFSPKSASSSVLIWFFHVLGLYDEARSYDEWPHQYRLRRFYQREDYLAARATVGPAQVQVLKVVRDPLRRAVSSFRHAVGLGYANEAIRRAIGVDVDTQGLSFRQFIDFLETEDLAHCDVHHREQWHPLEAVKAPDMVINIDRGDLFSGLNAFEARLGLPITDLRQLSWLHELQATRVPEVMTGDLDTLYQRPLTVSQARHGPWPAHLLSADARQRLQRLYGRDVMLYA
ncbi:sulfotransferase family protein [Ideonella dechloratans]|uniref:Sulfotransferase family protein n=1 Tax=Ideonella dechloratans TaxID=36863 RepID=A0A643FDT3_IDEDE|nr:sulfotransferase family 2 domain-containing protein [Ideonella dechloratans]KAB0583245.1 sulfotransferase family protein [Ideonella dechloratans]UFU10571.1 sulfotransferase family 2 domain-containing protein [Ideonella dechloratans]